MFPSVVSFSERMNVFLLLVRDEGKVSRKLIECVNTYLLKDGPNLGSNLLEIHNSVQQFVFRCWMVTHDRALKVRNKLDELNSYFIPFIIFKAFS